MLRQLQRSLRANDVRALVSTTAATAEAGPAATGDAPSRFTWRDSLKYRVRKAFQADAEQPEQQAVHAGVLLERYPICLPEVPQWRHDFAHWQSDWNAWRYKVAKKGWLDTTQRAADDQSQEAKFRPEPLLTEADEANDRHSLRRRTQGYLYLMLQDRVTGAWRLPRTLVTAEDASIRAAVERGLTEAMGDSMEAFLIGHAPAAHVRAEDANTFYMLGVVLDGVPRLAARGSAKDFAWMTRAEVLEVYGGDEQHSALVRALAIDTL